MSISPVSNKNEVNPTECVICFNTMLDSVMSTCGHSYCLKCIEQWKSQKSSCPLCNKKITQIIPNYTVRDIINSKAAGVQQVASAVLPAASSPRLMNDNDRPAIVQNTLSFPCTSQTSSAAEPPRKYIKIDGIMQLNPAYKTYQESQRKSDAMVNGLGKIFAKHEVPMGLMNKLMCFSEYDEIEFMIDDSGSMGEKSDIKDIHGHYQTRWQEAQQRMKVMLEILAYVPAPNITICFLNRHDTIKLQRKGETPEKFLEAAYKQVDSAFKHGPSGTTPAKERLEQSFNAGHGKRVARYIFCDGLPNGGSTAIRGIIDMIKNRPDPKGNPVTFLSCSDNDEQVEWMIEAEKMAPYCSEYGYFADEAN